MRIRTMLRRLVLILAVLAVASTALAQPRSTDLWIPLVEASGDVDRGLLEQVFSEVLASAPDTVHIVGRSGIEALIARGGFALPGCFEGFDVCTTPLEAVAHALGADRVIYARAQEAGMSIELSVLDIELDRTTIYEVSGESLRQTVFAAVGAVTDASGTLILHSAPEGARIYLDDTLVGMTPYDSTLGVGSYALRLELDGHFDHGTTIELRAGDVREQTIELRRRYADVTISCDAPRAEVVVDDDQVFAVGEPMHLDPGTRTVRIQAPGYDSDERVLELIAGETRSYSVILVESAETIARRQYDTILARPVVVRLALAGAARASAFDGASGDGATVGCPGAGVVSAGPCGERIGTGTLGAEIGVAYDWAWFELGLFGVGYHRLNPRRSSLALTDGRAADDTSGGRSISLTLPAPGGRWLVDERFEVTARTGPRLQLDSFGATVEGADIRLSRVLTTWELTVEGRYHFSARYFGFGELFAGVSLGGQDSGPRLGGSFGVGVNLDDPFGLDTLLDDRFGRGSQPAAAAPTEL